MAWHIGEAVFAVVVLAQLWGISNRLEGLRRDHEIAARHHGHE